MVSESIRDGSAFGIVLAKDDGILNAGCTVTVEKVLEMYPDGRMDIMAHGEHRIEIIRLIEDKEYLQGEVAYFDDEDLAPVPTELRTEALTHYRALNGLASARNHSDPDYQDQQLSFQLAQAVPDLEFLSLLLRARSEASRLSQFNQYLDEYLPRQLRIERMRELAPPKGPGPQPAR